jgi:hypothetical protein
VHDPDPSTFDQRQLFQAGTPPTFNSPDIDTIDIWPLEPAPTLTATVRNLSADASANQTRVDISWSPWGIGLPRQPLTTSFVDLARAGFPGSEQTLSWPLPPQMKAAGLFGLFVNVIHPYDTDLNNNQGEQTLDAFRTSSTGRLTSFTVPVGNPTASAQDIALTAGPAVIASWVTFDAPAFTLAPGAVRDVKVTIEVPAAMPVAPAGSVLSAVVDVLATMGGGYLGGVSFIILVDA